MCLLGNSELFFFSELSAGTFEIGHLITIKLVVIYSNHNESSTSKLPTGTSKPGQLIMAKLVVINKNTINRPLQNNTHLRIIKFFHQDGCSVCSTYRAVRQSIGLIIIPRELLAIL